jgi:beta-lactamase class A
MGPRALPRRVAVVLLRTVCLAIALAGFTLISSATDAEPQRAEPPAYLRALVHDGPRAEPGWKRDVKLQACVDRAIVDLRLDHLAKDKRMGIALVDLAGTNAPALAEVNGGETLYGASITKLGLLYATFVAASEGRIDVDDNVSAELTLAMRDSSNAAANALIDRVGFDRLAASLWQSGLYDPRAGGGLWIGKTFGSPRSWHRDPVKGLDHAASALALARFMTLLAQGKLIDQAASARMKSFLAGSAMSTKFVRGLEARPRARIFRKSGTWLHWHADAALVERGDRRYVAAALIVDVHGSEMLEQLIVAFDDCTRRR